MNKKILKIQKKFKNELEYKNIQFCIFIGFLNFFLISTFILNTSFGYLLMLVIPLFVILGIKNFIDFHKLSKNNNELLENKEYQKIISIKIQEYVRKENKKSLKSARNVIDNLGITFIDNKISNVNCDYEHKLIVQTKYRIKYVNTLEDDVPKINISYQYYDLNNFIHLLEFYDEYESEFDNLIMQQVSFLKSNIENYTYDQTNSTYTKIKNTLIEEALKLIIEKDNVDINSFEQKQIKKREETNSAVILGNELIKDIKVNSEI